MGVVPDERERHERAHHRGEKTSTLRGMPVDVLANAFGVSREEARRIKFGRGQEVAIFSPMSGGGRSTRPRGFGNMLAAVA